VLLGDRHDYGVSFLGSIFGDREKNLRDAIAALVEPGARLTRVSSFYETGRGLYRPAVFLNCVSKQKRNCRR